MPKATQLVPRQAVAALLSTKSNRYKLFDADAIGKLLSVAVDADNNDSISIDVVALVPSAFAEGNRAYEYEMSYDLHNFNKNGVKMDYILYAKRYRQDDTDRSFRTLLGCFKNLQHAQSVEELSTLDVGLTESIISKLTTNIEQQSKKREDELARKNKNESSSNKKQKVLSAIDIANDEVKEAEEALAAARLVVRQKIRERENIIAKNSDNSIETLQNKMTRQTLQIKQEKDVLSIMLSDKAKTQSKIRKLQKQRAAEQPIELDQSERNEVDDSVDEMEEFTDDRIVQLLSIINGRACKQIMLKPNTVICLDDLVSNLTPLSYTDTEESRSKRLAKKYHVETFGAVQLFVPSGAVSYPANHLARLMSDSSIVKRLKKLLSGERCRFSPESMRKLTAFAQHNSGGSDEGTQMVIAGTLQVVVDEIELILEQGWLGKCTPSQEWIRTWDMLLGVDCFIVQCHELNESGCESGCVASDHGRRNRMTSLVKVVAYASYDAEGNMTVEYFCIDLDMGGHKTIEASDGIAKSLERLRLLCPNFKITGISGDKGGGGAVDRLYGRLVEIGVLDKETARWINCTIHGLNKSAERPSKGTFGDVGVKQNSFNQLLYLSMRVLRLVRGESDSIRLSEHITRMVIHKLATDLQWEQEAAKNSLLALDKFTKDMTELDIDALEEYSKFNKNILEANWCRWESSVRAARILEDKWHVIYFICVAITQSKDVKSYIKTLAVDTLALMKTKATGDPKGEPLFLCECKFFLAFDKAYLNNAFQITKREDPLFPGSYGARLWPERIFILKKILLNLRGDNDTDEEKLSWEAAPEFQEYRESIKNLPELGEVSNGGIEFFRHLPKVFFDECIGVFNRMIEDTWRNEKMMVYLIAGNPILARLFLKCLAHVDGGGDMDGYNFPSETIQLEYHDASNKTVEIDTRECLDYLLKGDRFDVQKICDDKFIQDHEDLLWQWAAADDLVNIFDKKTWGNVDYTQILDAIHAIIIPHLPQTQIVESYVQTLNIVSRTGIKENHRTSRGITHSTIMRPFNQQSVKDKRDRVSCTDCDGSGCSICNAKRAKITRVKDAERVNGMAEYMKMFSIRCHEALEVIGPDKRKTLIADLTTSANKASTEEIEAEIELYEAGIKKARRPTKAEENTNGMVVTAQMGGKITLGILYANRGHNEHIDAEIKERGIALAKPLTGKGCYKFQEKKDLLKTDEHKILTTKDLSRELTVEQVMDIVPQSDKLCELFEYQREHYMNKNTKKK